VVFSASINELLEKGCLPRRRVLRVYTRLSSEEYEEWKKFMKIYAEFCKSALPRVGEPRRRLAMVLELASKDSGAREAMRARLRAREIVLAFEKKIRVVAKLLNMFSDDPIVVFSRYEDFIRKLSRKLIVPAILPEIPDDERRAYMNMFNRGALRVLATSTLLDEYVEAPQPSIAIVVGGVSSDKEYVDRVARTLMPRRREALLIEVLTARPSVLKNSFTGLEKSLGGAT
jgi:superfamily II DNA or RNA helicase